jgi:hypothetical protein
VPVNNKWVVPATFLEIMRGVNLPEFDMDLSFVYHLQYSADTLDVENAFSRSMETGTNLEPEPRTPNPQLDQTTVNCRPRSVQTRVSNQNIEETHPSPLTPRPLSFTPHPSPGDYLDTNNFTIYNGAMDFQGLGAGFDGYRSLAQV